MSHYEQQIETKILETLELYVGSRMIFLGDVVETLNIDYLSFLQINYIVQEFLKKYPEYHECLLVDREVPISNQSRIYYTVLTKRQKEPPKYTYANIIHQTDEAQSGDRLRKYRKDTGLSIIELAGRTGIGARTIEAYELGKRRFDGASVDYVKKIADELHVAIEELID